MINNCTEKNNSMANKVSFGYILGFFNQFYLFMANILLNTHTHTHTHTHTQQFKPSPARNLQKTFYIHKYSSLQEQVVSPFSRSDCIFFRERKFLLSNTIIY